MYFVPPGFEPGPTALAVAAVLLLVMLLRPLFSTRTYADAPGAPAPLTQLAVVHLGFVLAEVVLSVAFLYTLHAATPAALGLDPMAVGPEHLWMPEGAGHWFGPAAGVALGGFALLAVLVWWEHRGGPGEPPPPTERLVPRTAAGWRLLLAVPVLDGLSGVLVFALVLYPTVAVLVDPWAAVLAAGWMWGWRSWRCPMNGGVGAGTLFGVFAALLYALGLPGFPVPGALIMVGMGAHRSILFHRLLSALADRADDEAPLEVLEVTVEDPGRR
ncbi:hypothetical protein ABZ249_18860 [Nocardiopsis sp. NPDC006139]|uniref:hypothetical protein n=1 Tax=unclassified Nocardiopsis TaxID=2649073 RepID=UPI0033B59605